MKTKSRIQNTASRQNIEMHALGVRLGIAPDIAGEERRGSRQMVESTDQLPVMGLTTSHRDDTPAFNAVFLAAGGKIRFKKHSAGDNLFVDVTLPPGWTKKATDHDMWTDLLDANGNKRAGIFYKAAFYDRFAHLSATARLYATSSRPYSSKPYLDQPVVPVVYDSNGRTVWSGAPIPTDPAKSWESSDQAREIAKAMLVKWYPDHEKLDAYWDVKEFKFE